MGEQDKNKAILKKHRATNTNKNFFKLFIGIRQVAEGCISSNPISIRFKVNTVYTFLELHTYKGKE